MNLFKWSRDKIVYYQATTIDHSDICITISTYQILLNVRADLDFSKQMGKLLLE